jgi:hypothetical protein
MLQGLSQVTYAWQPKLKSGLLIQEHLTPKHFLSGQQTLAQLPLLVSRASSDPIIAMLSQNGHLSPNFTLRSF